MTDLSKQQCQTLDQILNSFNDDGYLERDFFIETFNNNEKLAAGYIDILVRNDLVSKIGETEESDIPLMLLKEFRTELFIENGGFIKQYEEGEKECTLKNLSEENLRLQNENLNYSSTIRNQEQRIRNMDEQNKFFEVIKNYWWFLAAMYALGVASSKLLL